MEFDTANKFYELEADLEKEACRVAKRRGWWHRKYKHPGRRAAPDRQFVKQGRHLYVEFKRWPNTPTRQQFEEHREMLTVGCDVVWLDAIEDFVAVLRNREKRIVRTA